MSGKVEVIKLLKKLKEKYNKDTHFHVHLDFGGIKMDANKKRLAPSEISDLLMLSCYLSARVDLDKVIDVIDGKDESAEPQPKEEKRMGYEYLEDGKMAIVTSFSEALLKYNDFLSDFLNGSFDLVIHKTMMKGVCGDNIPLCVVVNTDKIINYPEGLMTVMPLN